MFRSFLVGLFLCLACSAMAQEGSRTTTASSTAGMPIEQKAMLKRVKVLKGIVAQLSANTSSLVALKGRVDETQAFSRTNRAALVKLAARFNSEVKCLESELSNKATKYELGKATARIATLERDLPQIATRITEVSESMSKLEAGEFTAEMETSVERLAGGVLAQAGGVLERLDLIETRLATVEEKTDKMFVVGAIARVTGWSFNREASAFGLGAGVSVDMPVKYGGLRLSAALGHGGTYNDHELMLVDCNFEYSYRWRAGLVLSAGFYLGDTIGFFELGGDQTPTINQFIGGRSTVGWDWSSGHAVVGALVGDDGHAILGHDVSVGAVFEAQVRF